MRLIHERAYIIGNAFSTAAYIRERLIFESGLLSRGYGKSNMIPLLRKKMKNNKKDIDSSNFAAKNAFI